ncbi:MAG: carboxylesterase/lipase family protein [Acidobacteriaceae bacterium]
MKRAFAVALAICSALPTFAANTSQPIVKFADGFISGQLDPATHVSSFKGLPFAAPPIGDLRWRAPQPPHSWTGIRDGSRFAPGCMQPVHGDFLPWTSEFLVHGKVSEDCLYLNVWTPNHKSDANLPVIVFIPGGGFVEGSGSVPIYNGTNLASTGLVVVTINYRLGVFGFLAYPGLTAESPHHASGNYGLLDQIAALRWVQRNIAAFGGNPHNVTAWGQSAGAMSIGDLLVSPLARGLFQRAQADSGLGSATSHMPSLHDAEQTGLRFASAHHAVSLEELRAIPADQLLPGPGDHFRFMPDIDGWLLTASPVALNQTASGSDVPVITGYQANDGMLFTPPIHSKKDFDDWVSRIYGSMSSEFQRLYPGGSLQQMQLSVTESNRDRDRVSMFLWATARLRHHHSPIFTYYFDRAIPWPQHPEFGAFHSGELPYFFRNLQLMDRPWQPIDHSIANTASAYLKAFASEGDPNQNGYPHWPAVNSASPLTMEIGAKTHPMPLANKERLKFWLEYFHSQAAKNAPFF